MIPIKTWITICRRCALFLLALLCVMLYARYIEPERLTVRTHSVTTEKPISDCKVVFFADTHFGELYSETHVEKIVEKINGLEADIVIFGGDLLDNYARDRSHMDLDYLKKHLSRIQAKSGKYAVWGNHDYGGGAVRIYEDFMQSCGFEVLDDESRTLDDYGINIIGYDDYLMGWTDPALYEVQSERFNIIVSHEPVIARFIRSKSDNFHLSGHTHGGQIRLPYITDKILPTGSDEFVKGLYTQEDIGTDTSLQMYTTSGIGMTKYPFRLFNVPEIIEINFTSAQEMSASKGPGDSGDAVATGQSEPVPMLYANGQLYQLLGDQEEPMGDSGSVAGEILSAVPPEETPQTEGQSNFGSVGNPYTRDDGNGELVVLIEDRWLRFTTVGDPDEHPQEP